MSRKSKTGCRRRAAFNRQAEVQRNRARLFLALHEILPMIRDGSNDTAGLREKCARALPLWKADLEFKRAAYAACGNVRPDQPGDVMLKVTLEAGAQGLSPDEIVRLQEPIWPDVLQWISDHKGLGEVRSTVESRQ